VETQKKVGRVKVSASPKKKREPADTFPYPQLSTILKKKSQR